MNKDYAVTEIAQALGLDECTAALYCQEYRRFVEA